MAYYFYSAYTITSQIIVDGSCTDTIETFSLSSFYTASLSTESGNLIVDPNAQQSFIDFLEFETCSGGQNKFSIVPFANVETTTEYATTTVQRVPVTQSRSIGPVSAFPG